MSDLLYAKERGMYVRMRLIAAAMGRWDVVEACDRCLDFIDKHSPRLDVSAEEDQ